jgi:hypothetical protein
MSTVKTIAVTAGDGARLMEKSSGRRLVVPSTLLPASPATPQMPAHIGDLNEEID